MAATAKILSVEAQCPKGHVTQLGESVNVTGWEQDCELCGSHGGVELDFVCAECNKSYTIDLNSW
jgi:hypothetical protein